MPHKTCDSCGQKCGCRSSLCLNCGYIFQKKEKPVRQSSGRRGYRICPSCNKSIPVRSHECGCGHVFHRRDTPNKTERQNADISLLKSLFHEITGYDEHEQEISLRFYDGGLRTYVSKCGNYRIRKAKTFQGVKLDRPYRLLEKGHDGDWVPAKYISRFKRFSLAVKSYVKRIDGTFRVRKVVRHPRATKTRKRLMRV